eukprot:CAMPEP_0175907336 /NCGR_PEP_ID=MMETSP0108-20121206/6011_1 /TAXON_ID=195067 ORGANISM="Goniomonas pacifica, Strain CCMP1869" /NCGR_SAMPLE_ID=MMETSP0108 /ASSEMBLY_ACC=CAM_ASM_000204 /LENGTH=111 /DNA_ID=CAMNT_0017229319 /DNA_START=101 /DNA_END=436 /DNA_ORIENTATION=-
MDFARTEQPLDSTIKRGRGVRRVAGNTVGVVRRLVSGFRLFGAERPPAADHRAGERPSTQVKRFKVKLETGFPYERFGTAWFGALELALCWLCVGVRTASGVTAASVTKER